MSDTKPDKKPIVIITGSSGNVGSALSAAIKSEYHVVGFDRPGSNGDIDCDLSSDEGTRHAIKSFSEKYGRDTNIAAVVHLAAYFDFSGEDSPLYQTVNVEGTARLLEYLQPLKVERFIYSSTMLVHRAGSAGERINEETEIKPRWAYPQSKAKTEAVIQSQHGKIPYLILRLAGLYDCERVVPTLAQQISRIYERDLKSVLYSGDTDAGQAFIHSDDMIDLFERAIRQRNELPTETIILAGEQETMSYQDLQNQIGNLTHGTDEWKTLNLPSSIAKAGAWMEDKAEPLIPDVLDGGEKPFIKPFMIDIASDHYELDISRARRLLGWQPQHKIHDELPNIIKSLKKSPLSWYRSNGITPPEWMAAAKDANTNPDRVRINHDKTYRHQHADFLWAHFLNIGLGLWLISAPFILGYESQPMIVSDVVSGVLVTIFASLSLSTRPYLQCSRWILGIIGIWLMSAPLIFWAPTSAAYLNGTLLGALITGFALLSRPMPGISPAAAQMGPEIPPGWDFSPSVWFQRLPIIALAFIGFYISRYMAAYQLGHIDQAWDPFFSGFASETKNGTEDIITSSLSEAWPVPDAGLGALVYMLEILTGMMGSRARWRTMPWLVLLFGLMIIPLGAVSITFIIIQPIILNTWCTLCLIAAAAMLLQIPYSFDEIVATIQFLRRRAKAGRPWLLILFTGDSDEEHTQKNTRSSNDDNFNLPVPVILKEVLGGGVSTPWNLLVCIGIGVWLMFTRITIGSEGTAANVDHLIGALVLTVTVTAFAEVVRSARYINMLLGASLLITPFIVDSQWPSLISCLICGAMLIIFSIRRGKIAGSYGTWDRYIV